MHRLLARLSPPTPSAAGARASDYPSQMARVGALLFGTAAIHFGGDGAIVRGYLYVWVAAFAAYFMPRRAAAAQVALIGAALALVLAIRDFPTPVLTWLIAFGTIASGLP